MRCNRRTTRRLLWTTGGFALVVGSAAAYFIVFGHSMMAKADTLGRSVTRSVSHDGSQATPITRVTAKDFESLWALELRRPLYDPPPPKVEKPVFKAPPFGAKLSGTLIDADQATAIFTDSKGKTVFLQVGQTIDQATVLSIAPKQVTLRYYEQELVIPLNTEESKRR